MLKYSYNHSYYAGTQCIFIKTTQSLAVFKLSVHPFRIIP